MGILQNPCLKEWTAWVPRNYKQWFSSRRWQRTLHKWINFNSKPVKICKTLFVGIPDGCQEFIYDVLFTQRKTFYRGTKQKSPLEIWNLLSEITEY